MAHTEPVALITGAAKRVGAACARHLHGLGWSVIIHYSHSQQEAEALVARLNGQRSNSATAIAADLSVLSEVTSLAQQASSCFGRIDALINNASSFYPTPIGQTTEAHWQDLFASNAQAPFFLTQALTPVLRQSPQASVVNLIDIHARYPLANHTVYCMAKAALEAMTRSLAKELAPEVRVNGVAPGVIAWPEGAGSMSAEQQADILASVPLGREGGVDAIAETVAFLVQGSRYVSGQIIAVDGGRSVWG